MNINKSTVVGLVLGACITSSVLTHLFEPQIMLLRHHGIRVSESFTEEGSVLMLSSGKNNIFVTMDFNNSKTNVSSVNVLDLTSTVVRAKDKDQDGRIDGLSFNVTRDGIDYVYSDPFLEGDYSRMSKARDGKPLGSFLKMDGKWVAAKHAGTKGIVMIDGKEMVVDPNKSPIAILGPLVKKPETAPK